MMFMMLTSDSDLSSTASSADLTSSYGTVKSHMVFRSL